MAYREAASGALDFQLAHSFTIRLVSAPLFIATKFEAFRGRGRGGYIAGHDLEGAVAVIDGRPELIGEVAAAVSEVRRYVASECRKLLRDDRFMDALPGCLAPDAISQARAPLILERVEALANLGVR
jgi:hypothetical protein